MVERFEAQVGADIKEFKRKMKQVDREIRELATGVEVDLDLATEEFHAEMQAVKKEFKGLDGKEARLAVELAYMEFRKQLAEVYVLAEKLDDYEIDVEIDAAITNFRRKLLQVRTLAADLEGTSVDVNVKLDASHFNRHYLKVSAMIAAMSTKTIVVAAKFKYAEFQNTMGKVANQMRTWGEIFGTMFSGSLISLVPTLSPIVSSLVGLIGSLGVMIGVLGGQMLILASALGIVATAFVGLGAVAIPTIKNLFDETAKLTAEQQRARDAWDSFVDVYDELVAKTEGAVLQGFTSAMQGAEKILQAFEPLIVGVSESLVRLMDAFNRSIDSAPIQKIFETFNKYGPSMFENMAIGIGYLVAGLGSLIAAFAPAAEAWTQNFSDMMASFAAWSDGLSENQKFQEFVAYIQEYMPLISQIFGDLILGIVDFFVAFSDMAGDFMVSLADMMSRFREWASALGENDQFQRFLEYIRESTPAVLDLIKNLWDFLINLGVAMAPFGAIVLDLANKFLSWMNSMMETHGWFSSLIGIIPTLIGGFMMLMAPIIGFTTLFGGPLIKAIMSVIKWFGSIGGAISRLVPFFAVIVDDVLRVIGVVTNLASKALPWLVRGFGLLTGPVGIAIAVIAALIAIGVALYKNWDTVSAYASKIWTSIANFFSTTIAGIYETVVGWFGKMWDGIVGWLDEMFGSISDTWTQVTGYLSGINLFDIGANIIQGLVRGIKSIPVIGSVIEIGEKIVGAFTSFFKIKSPSRLMASIAKWIPAGVAKGITDNINLVKSASKEMNKAVTLDFSKEVDKSSQVYKNLMKDIEKTVKATSKKTQVDRYEALEQSLSDYKKWTDLTLAEEYAYWREASKYLKDGTGAKNKALQNASNMHKQVLQEQYENEVKFTDAAREYGITSLRDQIYAYQVYMSQYKVGSDQQLAYEEKIYNAKKALYESLKDVTSNYLTKVQDVYSKLADEEQKLRDQYQQTFEARRDTLANTWGLFDEVKLTEMTTYKEDGSVDKQIDLIGNMRQQVSTLSNWMNDIFRLQSFGLNEALLDELQQMGPKAAAEINALANMSSQQLGEYEMLWKTKMDLAGKQATTELEGARLDMEAEIVKLRENAVVELDKMKTEMLNEVNEMVNGSTDQFNVLQMTLPEIGKKAMEGLINGLKSMKGSLKTTVQGIANDVSREMTSILQGVNFNATSLTPSIAASSSMKVDTSVYNQTDLAQPQVNLNLNSTWTGGEVKYWMDEQDATNVKTSIKKK